MNFDIITQLKVSIAVGLTANNKNKLEQFYFDCNDALYILQADALELLGRVSSNIP